MLLNQTDVAVDEELGKVIITTDTALRQTSGTVSRAMSSLPLKLQNL